MAPSWRATHCMHAPYRANNRHFGRTRHCACPRLSPMSERKSVAIYTRGISSPHGGGYGVLLLSDGHRKELSGGALGATNNRMDLLAAVEGLRALKYHAG